MPELPEVESIAQGLRREIVGSTITSIVVRKPVIVAGPYRRRWRLAGEILEGRRICSVFRRAKRLVIVADGAFGLIVQLGMTGKFSLAGGNTPLAKHTHFIVNFLADRQLRFIDPRRFGRVWFLDMAGSDVDAAMLAAGMTRLGPEPSDISLVQFRQILQSQRAVKSLLLDQIRIAGLGNIYADEALFAACIHPERPAASLTGGESAQLRRSVRSVLRRAVEAGGTTFSDFRNAYGEPGQFVKCLRVYQRTGMPCRKCRSLIERIVISGRSSHFCPQCQANK